MKENLSRIPSPEVHPIHVDDYRRISRARRFRPVPDHATVGNPPREKERRDLSTVVHHKTAVERRVAQQDIQEALQNPGEVVWEIKPEEKRVEIDKDSKVVPLFIRPGVIAWQSL